MGPQRQRNDGNPPTMKSIVEDADPKFSIFISL